jgi:hypothetical protein
MALLDANSCECAKSELEIFSVLPTQTSIEEERYEKFYPLTSLTSNAPIEFLVVPSSQEYIDPRYTYLYLKCKILENGDKEIKAPASGAVPAKACVYPVNNIHQSIFKTVEVAIGNKQISEPTVSYPYKAFIETLLSYDLPTINSQLSMQMFYVDDGELDEHSDAVSKSGTDQSSNSGAVYRFTKTKFSKSFETIGRIHSELFTQPKLLLPVELRLKFHRKELPFCLMSAADDAQRYSIAIETAVLNVCLRQISPSVREAHQATLLKTPAKYPVRKVDVKYFTRSAGRSDISEQNVVNGTLPRRLIVGLVDSRGFTGSYHHNPFNFQHYNLKRIAVRVNGQKLPFEDIECDFANGLFYQGYMSLFHGTSRLFKDLSLGIEPVDYANGHTLYAFDLTPDTSDANNISLVKEGNISLEIQLENALPEAITIITYLEFDAIIEIDHAQNVSMQT